MKYRKYYIFFKIMTVVIVAEHIMSLTLVAAPILADSKLDLIFQIISSILFIIIFAVYYFTDPEV